MSGTSWIEVVFCPPGGDEQSSSFVARTDLDAFLAAPDSTFWRFDYVRWLDDEEHALPNESDDGYGTDHYFYLRKSTIYRVEPVRGEFVAQWDSTLPDLADLG